MQPEFWRQRWRNNRIGFHLGQVNPYLVKYWPTLGLHAGSRVFVPLCGKSLDMLWLAEQGYEVVGVEISPIAVRAFFEENRLEPEITQQGAFEIWVVDQITILLGDFFELTPGQLGEVAAVYDRASLIALPADMRAGYVEHLHALCPAVPRLLITLDYDQSRMAGPPFAVGDEEVRDLYAERGSLVRLAAEDVLADNPRFREQGLDRMVESVWRMGA
ncbi:MAG TPA: thiopurine S-methyltransferase [Chromatiales bacterium]|nr:thiopurine S-methyltransferase [Chromatiales bacterium]